MEDFFGESGNRLEANDAEELKKFLSAINTDVPQRTEGRTHDHVERHHVTKYLSFLVHRDLLYFPLAITKGESPDFIVESRTQGKRGIEVTEAITPDLAKALKQMEKNGEPLMGKSLTPKQAASEWADVMVGVIMRKEKKLKSGIYESCDSNEILVYDNTEEAGLLVNQDDYQVAIEFLKSKLTESKPTEELHFRRVIVIDDHRVLYDVLGDYVFCKYPSS